MGPGVLVGAIILWIVPIFVGHAMGKPRRRWGAAYGLCLGWLGIVVLALLPALPELSPTEQLARLERQRGQLRPKYLAKEEARLRAALARATRECPFCKGEMRRDASVCRHCQRDSDAWIYDDGQWRARSGHAWYARVESTGEWEPLQPLDGTSALPEPAIRQRGAEDGPARNRPFPALNPSAVRDP